MFGLLLAFCVSISEAGKDIFFSSSEVKKLPHLVKARAMALFSLPVVGLVVAFTGLPTIQPEFWKFVSIHAGLMVVATWLYMRALALGPLSQTQPILALTTVFLTITNPIMTNESVTVWGWIGVVMIGLGVYATQHPGRDPNRGWGASLVSPFVQMVKQPGVMSKLGVAFIFSITANLDQLARTASNGPTYLLIDLTLIVILITIVMKVLRQPSQIGWAQWKGGAINSLTILFHMWALVFAPVPYVIAVKRLSIVFTSLWGYRIRKERELNWYRLMGVLIVVGGVALIILKGK